MIVDHRDGTCCKLLSVSLQLDGAGPNTTVKHIINMIANNTDKVT